MRSTAGRALSPDCSIRIRGCSRSRRTGHSGERSHTAGLADRQKHRDGHWHLGDALYVGIVAFRLPIPDDTIGRELVMSLLSGPRTAA